MTFLFSLLLLVWLTRILEIVAPVGMLSVCFSRVPTRERSFGPTPRSSSEGFLGTFTPRVRRILFNPLDFLSEYVSKGSFHFDFSDRALSRRGFTFRAGDSPWFTRFTKKRYNWEFQLAGLLILPVRRLDTISYESNPRNYRGEVLWFEVMNPGPRGILEPSNPTEEALKEGRNTKTEEVRDRLLTISSRASFKRIR